MGIITEEILPNASSIDEAVRMAYVNKSFTYKKGDDLLVFNEGEDDFIVSGTSVETVNATFHTRKGLNAAAAFVIDIRRTAHILEGVWQFNSCGDDWGKFEELINIIWQYARVHRKVDARSFEVIRKYDKYLASGESIPFEGLKIQFLEYCRDDVGGSYDVNVIDQHLETSMTVTVGALYRLGLSAIKDRYDGEA